MNRKAYVRPKQLLQFVLVDLNVAKTVRNVAALTLANQRKLNKVCAK